MLPITGKLAKSVFRLMLKRQVHSTTRCSAKAAYEGEGKTTVKILNLDPDSGLLIDAYGTHGFRLNNGVTVLGPMAIFPKTVMSWQVRGGQEVTPESLKFFKLLEPKLDLIIVGLETNQRHIIDKVFLAARATKLNVEILPIEHACSTFNFLNAECRSVAGAMIPPLMVSQTDDDMFQTKKDQGTLYEIGHLPDN